MDIVGEELNLSHWFVHNFVWLNLIGVIVFSIRVLSDRVRRPQSALAWIFSFVCIPVLSEFFYLIAEYRQFDRKRKRRELGLIDGIPETVLAQDPFKYDSGLSQIARLVSTLVQSPVTFGNQVELFTDSNKLFHAISEEVLKAKHSVHLEYYIFRLDSFGRQIFSLLKKSQTERRLLVDDVGSYKLSGKEMNEMRTHKIKVARFLPVILARPWGFHFRNHRKLFVIDQSVAFIGSQNIGEEYSSGHRKKSKHWRDLVARIEGQAAVLANRIFMDDWSFSTGERATRHEDAEMRSELKLADSKSERSGALQIIPTGPDENESKLELILVALCHYARQSIKMITPYFVPTEALLRAIEGAICRGVKVEVLVPKKTDYWVMDQVQRAWLRRVADIGAEVYIDSGSFLHAKALIFDDAISLVGSANMDERSFRLNFELSALFYDPTTAQKMRLIYEDYKAKSRRYSPSPPSGMTKPVEGFFRVLSPFF